MSGDPHTHLIPYHEDPLVRLAQLLLDREQENLPDLSRAIVLFPDSATSQRFRYSLLSEASSRGLEALIPPSSGSLRSWLFDQNPAERRVLGQNERELLLMSALADFPELTGRYGTWPLIDSLLTLFDELSLNYYSPPSELHEFRAIIEDAYGIQELAPLSSEARLVHDLWQAWQRQLEESDADDETNAYLAALRKSANNLPPEQHIYLAGFLQFHRAEREWISALRSRGCLDLVLHGSHGASGHHPSAALHDLLHDLNIELDPVPPAQPYSRMLEAVFELGGQPLHARAAQQQADAPDSPARDQLEVCVAENPEYEARVVDIQVRRWLLEGLTDIGVVTNDRRLARRIRALLERANIYLADSAGWALSTTSAASAVIHWLDCVEHNFHFSYLLDCLKSPFLTSFVDKHGGPARVSQFEQGIVYRLRLSADMQRYLDAVSEHAKHLDSSYGEGSAAAIREMLTDVSHATRPLVDLSTTSSANAEMYFDAISRLLVELGLNRSLGNDAAGKEIIFQLEELELCARHWRLNQNWQSFRGWLMRHLERHMFRPPLTGSGIELMGFAESRLYRFQAVIIAGVSREHLPGGTHDSPFFNEGVRQQLCLPSRYLIQRIRLADFRRLLEAAPKILITSSSEQDDKPIIPSPWLERLQAFHQLAYGSSIDAPLLRQMSQNPATQIHRDPTQLPETENAPHALIPKELLPLELSATGYQRLVECPFSFFANYCLDLKPVNEIADELQKSDYGSLVHRSLQLFHSQPESFVIGDTVNELEQRLTEISEAVFAPVIKRQPSARGWFYLWLRIIPVYLKWQAKRALTWQVMDTELKCKTRLMQSPPLDLVGRLDRVDRTDDSFAIIDYKTGKTPTRTEIETGESVQLPFYALLLEKNTKEVCALEFNDAAIKDRAAIGDDALASLALAHEARIQEVFASLAGGDSAPAWGGPETCQHCHYANVCRKDLWEQGYDAA